jgi:hypothetical protein
MANGQYKTYSDVALKVKRSKNKNFKNKVLMTAA